MHVGLTMFPTDYAIPPHDLAVAAEARGYESLWLPEHSHIPTSRKSPWPGGAELPKYYYDTYDPFLSLAAAGGHRTDSYAEKPAPKRSPDITARGAVVNRSRGVEATSEPATRRCRASAVEQQVSNIAH